VEILRILLESNEKLACHVYIFVSFVVRIKRLPDCKWSEARIHNISREIMIVRVSVVLRRTVCDNTDWRIDNLSGNVSQCHHKTVLLRTTLIWTIIIYRVINGYHQLAKLMRYLTSRSCDNYRLFTFHSMQSLVHFFPQYDFVSSASAVFAIIAGNENRVWVGTSGSGTFLVCTR